MTLVFPKASLGVFPKHLSPDYRSTVKRSPSKPLIIVPHTLSELTGPAYGHDAVQEGDADLTKQHIDLADRKLRPWKAHWRAAVAAAARLME